MERKAAVMQAVETEKIIVIVRGVEKDKLCALADALYAADIRFMEITFDQTGACTDAQTADKIRTLKEYCGDRMHIGAGTVLKEEQVQTACEAGAEFIISPDVNESVIRRTVACGMISMPGALTPTEVMQAHRAGADYVKLFPVGELGVSYFKAVKAPLSGVKLLAVGGITADNIAAFEKAGAAGYGISSSIVDRKLVAENRFDVITEKAKEIRRQIV